MRRTAVIGAMGSGRVWMRRLRKSPPGYSGGGVEGVEEGEREQRMRRVSAILKLLGAWARATFLVGTEWADAFKKKKNLTQGGRHTPLVAIDR